MPKNFEINRTKIKGGCQSGIKAVTHNSKSDLPLVWVLEVLVSVGYEIIYNEMVVNKKERFFQKLS